MNIDWPSVAAVGDVVIVLRDLSSSSRFVVLRSDGTQVACASYAEAEACAATYAEGARATVWYMERGRLQFVCSFCNRSRGRETPVQDPHL